MHAVIIRSFGGPEVLEPADLPKPNPREGEVLIHVRAAGVNPVDYKIRSGAFGKEDTPLPMVLGRDVSGTVESVGPGVTSVKPGDEVYAFLGFHSGGYAEFALARETEVAGKPRSLDFVESAAVPLAATTAWQALFDHGQLQPGQRVLIQGAGGGVGHFAVQFAKAKGATVFAVADGKDFKLLKMLGVDELIDYKRERFEDRAKGVDLVIDLVGGKTQERSWSVLKRGGAMVSTVQQPSEQKARENGARGTVFMAQPRHEQLVTIAKLIDDGKVVVAVSHTHPLDEAKEVHEELENEHSRGKLVLTVS
jgi:NADPH:quinone reductase-like Zn-dependent oxidoreductase